MRPELVIPSCCEARASFEVDALEGLGEDVWCEMTLHVLSAWAEGYSRGPRVVGDDHKRLGEYGNTHLANQDCALISTSNLLITLRCIAA
jgi:hypothetical protein